MDSYRKLIEEAFRFDRWAFERDFPVNGGDLVDWFGEWRIRAKAVVLKESKRRHAASRRRRRR